MWSVGGERRSAHVGSVGDFVFFAESARTSGAETRLANATVDGEFVCSAELMFSIASDPRVFGADASVLHA